MVTLARIIYASRMVDAIDPARLDRLPADVRAAFEAQAKALAETRGDDKVRVNHQSFPNSLVALENQALKAVGRQAIAHRQGAALGRVH